MTRSSFGSDGVDALGPWHVELHSGTPLLWLPTGLLDRYLLQLWLKSESPSTAGFVFHAEADGPGTDGASFWVERRLGHGPRGPTRRYLLAGGGLASPPKAGRAIQDPGGELAVKVELLVEGSTGIVLLEDRQVRLPFRLKASKGSVGLYNATAAACRHDAVRFVGLRVTALCSGPVEVQGRLRDRERSLLSANLTTEQPERRRTLAITRKSVVASTTPPAAGRMPRTAWAEDPGERRAPARRPPSAPLRPSRSRPMAAGGGLGRMHSCGDMHAWKPPAST